MTINATTCSQQDVQTAIDAAQEGDTVMVMTGTCAWTAAVNTLKGAGIIISR